MPLAQARRVAVSSLRERTTRYAASTSSHRARAFPALVIHPTHRFLPELHSPGTISRYTSNSCAEWKHVMSLMVATSALAVIGPMLGTVVSNVPIGSAVVSSTM